MGVVKLTDQYWALMVQVMLFLFLLGALLGTLLGRWWGHADWMEIADTASAVHHGGYKYWVTRERDEQEGVDEEVIPDMFSAGFLDLKPNEIPVPHLRSVGRDEAQVEAGIEALRRVVPAATGRRYLAAEDEYALGVESWDGGSRAIRG